jgi:hypothetical protein
MVRYREPFRRLVDPDDILVVADDILVDMVAFAYGLDGTTFEDTIPPVMVGADDDANPIAADNDGTTFVYTKGTEVPTDVARLRVDPSVEVNPPEAGTIDNHLSMEVSLSLFPSPSFHPRLSRITISARVTICMKIYSVHRVVKYVHVPTRCCHEYERTTP